MLSLYVGLNKEVEVNTFFFIYLPVWFKSRSVLYVCVIGITASVLHTKTKHIGNFSENGTQFSIIPIHITYLSQVIITMFSYFSVTQNV